MKTYLSSLVMGNFSSCVLLFGIPFVIVGGLFVGVRAVGTVKASFILGDSLVDAGNNNYIASLAKANLVPNGIDLMPGRQPTGRFTNGRTVTDIIDQELGLDSFTPPYLAPTTTGAAILNGVNYASGGGGILNLTGKIFGGRINFDAQIDNYANTRQDIISSLGMTAALSLLRKALFSVIIGSNDFLDNYLTPILSAPERASVSPEMFVESMISKYRLQLTRLYDLDARKFFITNIGPIGCIPYSRDINLLSGNNCVEFPNQLAQYFNKRLKDLVMELTSNLEGVHFAIGDVYRIVSDITQNSNSYGFEVVDSACCFLVGRFGGILPCGPTSKVCPDRSKYFFWDAYHPSDAANVLIAKRLLDGGPPDVFPVNIRQLARA